MLSSIETEATLNDKQVRVTMYFARSYWVPLTFSAGGQLVRTELLLTGSNQQGLILYNITVFTASRYAQSTQYHSYYQYV